MNQSELAQWTAGMFDGDGSIRNGISHDETCKVDHSVTPSCSIASTYVAGIFDAEGSISAGVATKDSYSLGHETKTMCRINHRENNELLSRLSEFSDSIGIDYSVYHAEKDGKRGDVFEFKVQRREHVRQFLEELKPYLTVKRRQAEIMISDIIPLLDERAHSTRRGFLRLMYHVDRLNENKGGSRGKYTLEYFEDLWGMEYDPSRYE